MNTGGKGNFSANRNKQNQSSRPRPLTLPLQSGTEPTVGVLGNDAIRTVAHRRSSCLCSAAVEEPRPNKANVNPFRGSVNKDTASVVISHQSINDGK